MEEKKLRLFVAVDFPDDVVKEVARLEYLLDKKNFRGKMTELENLHLTLKFLGSVDATTFGKSSRSQNENRVTVEEVKKRLKKVKFLEFEGTLDSVGLFNFRGNPRIVWVKVGGSGIFELQEKIDEAFNGLLDKEERFMSHMTIARVKQVKNKKEFSEYVKNMGLKKVKFKINSFKLMKSELRKLGPVYSVVEEYKV